MKKDVKNIYRISDSKNMFNTSHAFHKFYLEA